MAAVLADPALLQQPEWQRLAEPAGGGAAQSLNRAWRVSLARHARI
jgi:hypothetical protein